MPVVKESAMKNKVEEIKIDITLAFINVSPIRNQAEKMQDGNKPDGFLGLIFDKIKRLDLPLRGYTSSTTYAQ
jgi:hypothetical protein